jgi:cytochrome oxidase Cu insertion factor (SCO1/SenC/PrrC family)
MARSLAGRLALAACALLLVAGLGLGAARVAGRAGVSAWAAVGAAPVAVPASYPRLDRIPAALDLVDQYGARFELSSQRGTRILLTFAYAHCETVCPLVVRNALEARSLTAGRAPMIVIVTLDPWRDTPERLPSLARQWKLGPRDRVLSGTVENVRRALADWNVPIQRDERTGELVHLALLYVIDAGGRIAYAPNGGVGEIVELVRRADVID